MHHYFCLWPGPTISENAHCCVDGCKGKERQRRLSWRRDACANDDDGTQATANDATDGGVIVFALDLSVPPSTAMHSMTTIGAPTSRVCLAFLRFKREESDERCRPVTRPMGGYIPLTVASLAAVSHNYTTVKDLPYSGFACVRPSPSNSSVWRAEDDERSRSDVTSLFTTSVP